MSKYQETVLFSDDGCVCRGGADERVPPLCVSGCPGGRTIWHWVGLYVVKKTIKAHGGSSDVAECLGDSSVFLFELPLNEAAATC